MSREQREAYGEGALIVPNLRALGVGAPAGLQLIDRVAVLFYVALEPSDWFPPTTPTWSEFTVRSSWISNAIRSAPY